MWGIGALDASISAGGIPDHAFGAAGAIFTSCAEVGAAHILAQSVYVRVSAAARQAD